MIENSNLKEKIESFKEQRDALYRECAQACLDLLKEYSITAIELIDPISADNEGKFEYVDALKIDTPESKLVYDWFLVRNSLDKWFSPEAGFIKFDWSELYENLCATINLFVEKGIAASEWNNRERVDELLQSRHEDLLS